MPKKLTDQVTDTPVEKPERLRSFTADELDLLAVTHPEKAALMLDLQEKLKGKRKNEADFEGLRKLQIRMLEEVEKQIEKTRRDQDLCTRARHMRENMTMALVGQRDNFQVIRLTCSRCQKSYEGIGGEKGLPMELAQFLNTETIGGVNA